MSPPTVSVVMAARNYARFLPAAVESVLAQTVTDWELLIIDDGSTDETPAAVRSFLGDRRVRYLASDRLGQPRAKNLGARLARGAFIAFLDADDAWRPTKLERQLDLLHARPAVGVCFCRRLLMDEAGTVRPANDPPAPRGRVLPAIFLRNFVCFSSVVVRRHVLEHVGGFDPDLDLAIDYDLWLRVARHYEFDFVDEELVLYRTGHGNLSKRLADRVATAEAIMNRALRRGLDLPPRVVGEGYASTYRALGYTLRGSEPLTAAGWYWRAFRRPGRRLLALRGLAASLLSWVRGPRAAAAAENAAVNRCRVAVTPKAPRRQGAGVTPQRRQGAGVTPPKAPSRQGAKAPRRQCDTPQGARVSMMWMLRRRFHAPPGRC
jgi:glycosyltransferase involved in cell wall biosynthesis